MAAWVALMAAVATAPKAVAVERWPAGDVAAVTLMVGLDPTEVPRSKRGLAAVFAQTLVAKMSEKLGEDSEAARELRYAIPSQSGVDVIRRPQYLAITVNCTGEAVEKAVDFLAAAVIGAEADAATVRRCKKAVLRRRDHWARDVPEVTEVLFERAIYEGVAPDAFYGRPETLRNITLRDVEDFRKRTMVRGNVALAAVVPGDWKSLAEKLRQALDKLPQGRRYRGPRVCDEGRVVVRDNPGLSRASMIVGGPLPPIGEKGYWAGWVIREMLAGPDGAIVRDRELTSRLGLLVPRAADWRSWPVQPLDVPIGPGPFVAVHAVCHPARIEAVRQALAAQFERLADGAFDDRELERAKVRAANVWARRTARPRERARLMAMGLLIGAEVPDAAGVCRRVDAVTRADVMATARQIAKRLCVGLQMPRP